MSWVCNQIRHSITADFDKIRTDLLIHSVANGLHPPIETILMILKMKQDWPLVYATGAIFGLQVR